MGSAMVARRRYLLGLIGTVLVAGGAIAGGCSQVPSGESGAAETTEAAVQRDPGTLRMLYSRVPVTLNPHLATGVEDFEAGRIVLEPLEIGRAHV